MNLSINLDNFRALTGGDSELEAELFRNFFASSDELIKGLRLAFQASDESVWRDQAHALKGICFNLGADHLGDLCKAAEDHYHALPEEKHDMIVAIESEFVRVRAAIENLLLTPRP